MNNINGGRLIDSDSRPIDMGTAYGRKKNAYDPVLTEVGPGTPMGELLRRYWHPIARIEEATSDLPTRVRVLGEDLILFRDGSGRVGLVEEHCCHRGTSLFYGRIEEDGIRCCYHGWKFDVQGHCLDQACEVDGGKRRDLGRQPWYPVQERYGAIWAYMGPPDQKPVLPRFDALENLEEGEFYEISTDPGYGATDELPFNWLQSYENTMDALHAVWLHVNHSGGDQFGQYGKGRVYNPNTDSHSIIKNISWGETPMGVHYTRLTPIDDQTTYYFRVENILPNATSVPNPVNMKRNIRQDNVLWHVPIDDTHFKIFHIGRVRTQGDLRDRYARHNGKRWKECTPEELQRYPGDFETQSTQGAIAIHADEHLAFSDQGVVLTRRKLRALIADMQSGKALLNVSFDENEAPRHVTAGSGTQRRD